MGTNETPNVKTFSARYMLALFMITLFACSITSVRVQAQVRARLATVAAQSVAAGDGMQARLVVGGATAGLRTRNVACRIGLLPVGGFIAGPGFGTAGGFGTLTLGLQINPTPAATLVHVPIPTTMLGAEVHWVVLDVQGTAVMGATFTGDELELDVSDLQSDSYTLLIQQNGVVASAQLIVQR